MPIREFRDLLCWQLADELKCEVLAFTAIPPVSRDFRFCDQIRDSASAAPRDIAEAFGRDHPRDSARFLEFAVASLMETHNSLIDAAHRDFLEPDVAARLQNLARATIRVTKRLIWSKRDRAEGRPKRQADGVRSFSITVAELEDLRRRRR